MRRSLAAIHKWGEPVPAALLPKFTREDLVAEHRGNWLRDAAAFLNVLDWQHLAGKRVAIVDFDDVRNIPAQGCFAFTSPVGLFDLLRPHMAASGLAPGPAMMLDTARISAAYLSPDVLDRMTEATASQTMRLVVNAVVMHEYAHAVDYEARGVTLPEGTTLDDIFRFDPSKKQARRSHSAGWLRAFAHLLYRSTALPCGHDHYVERFQVDVHNAGCGQADDHLDALHADFLAHGTDKPVVEILRTPAPAGFTTLFDERDAARSANGA